MSNTNTYNYILDVSSGSINVDLSSYNPEIYSVTLISDGIIKVSSLLSIV